MVASVALPAHRKPQMGPASPMKLLGLPRFAACTKDGADVVIP